MVPSNTHTVIGATTIAGILARSDIKPHDFYAVEGFVLHELLILAQRMNYRFDDPNEKRDWENRLNSIVHESRKHKMT